VKELEARGLRFFNAYLTVSFSDDQAALTPGIRGIIDGLQGHGSALWIALAKVSKAGKALPRGTAEGDEVALARLREIGDYAKQRGVAIALYPHTGMWLERCEDTVRLAQKINRPDVGATFNLCHFLKVEGDRDPGPVLKAALPHLSFVTINGADAGDTQKMNWDRLIQTLDRGSYDVGKFLQTLRRIGYAGPIGLQGYGIKGDEKENLTRSMEAWRRFSRSAGVRPVDG